MFDKELLIILRISLVLIIWKFLLPIQLRVILVAVGTLLELFTWTNQIFVKAVVEGGWRILEWLFYFFLYLNVLSFLHHVDINLKLIKIQFLNLPIFLNLCGTWSQRWQKHTLLGFLILLILISQIELIHISFDIRTVERHTQALLPRGKLESHAEVIHLIWIFFIFDDLITVLVH